MIFLVRHGERGDQTTTEEAKKVENINDTHLTELGLLQGFCAGQVISEKVKKAQDANVLKKNVRYLVVSSPYLRCIQTAEQAIQALGIENVVDNQIKLDFGIGEKLSKWLFNKCPLPSLHINQKNSRIPHYIKTPLQYGLYKNGKHTGCTKYPESSTQSKLRQELYQTILKHFKENYDQESTVLLLFSHAYQVKKVLMMYDKFKESDYFDYTSVNQFVMHKKDVSKGVVITKNYLNHLQVARQKYQEVQEQKKQAKQQQQMMMMMSPQPLLKQSSIDNGNDTQIQVEPQLGLHQ